MGFLTAAHSRSIWTACQLLVPYVDACPACADNLVHSGQGFDKVPRDSEGKPSGSLMPRATARRAKKPRGRTWKPRTTAPLNYCAKETPSTCTITRPDRPHP
jgi:hypothetical protein